jgi:succinate dehydrogenase / fumarate reductase membrane anchor subunit
MTNPTTISAAPANARTRRVLPPPRNNIERVAWLFMRYSGLVLIFLALSHWGLQHVINSVHDLTLQSTVNRWGAAGQAADFSIWFWRAYYAVLLGLAMLHGLNGLRQVAYDYVHIRPLYWGFMALATLLILFVSVAGLVALFMGVNAAAATAAATATVIR